MKRRILFGLVVVNAYSHEHIWAYFQVASYIQPIGIISFTLFLNFPFFPSLLYVLLLLICVFLLCSTDTVTPDSDDKIKCTIPYE